MVNFACFAYYHSFNVGDYIQSAAVERVIPSVASRFNRDPLAKLTDEVLAHYKKEVTYIITARLHCALPCKDIITRIKMLKID